MVPVFGHLGIYTLSIGFENSKTYFALFVLRMGNDYAYLLLYMDDIILTASNTTLGSSPLISSLNQEFSMTNLGC